MDNLISNAKVAPQWKLNAADINAWLLGVRDFLIPLALIYVLQVYASVQNGPLGVNDLIPTQITIGALELYILNQILGILRKFSDNGKS